MSEDVVLGSAELTALSKLLKKLALLPKDAPGPHPQPVESYQPSLPAMENAESSTSSTIPPALIAKRKYRSITVPIDTAMLSKIETEVALRREAGISHARTEIIREAIVLYFMERAKGMPIWHLSNVVDMEERQRVQNLLALTREATRCDR